MSGIKFEFMKYRLLLVVAASALLTAGCNTKSYPYREPNQGEISSFIPYGYELLTNEQKQTSGLRKVNIDGDEDKEFLLLLQPGSQNEYSLNLTPQFLLLDFNSIVNNWDLKFGKQDLPGESLDSDVIISDADNNGIDEFHVQGNQGCGSECQWVINIYTVNNGQVVNVIKDRERGYVSRYKADTNDYYFYQYKWAENETHFGCHYFSVAGEHFNGVTLVPIYKADTTVRYALDEAEAQGCELFSTFLVDKNVGLSQQ
jgi:hypothetical protein